MKHLTFSLLIYFLLHSCSTTHQSSKSEDISKSVKSIEMKDKWSAYPLDLIGKKTSEKTGNIRTIHRFEALKKGKANVSVEFLSGALIAQDGLDSVVCLWLDGEKIEIHRVAERLFEVPENLWVAISHSGKIEYHIKSGKGGLNLRPNQTQTKNLKYFFERAIKNRDANLNPLPEGLKKW